MKTPFFKGGTMKKEKLSEILKKQLEKQNKNGSSAEEICKALIIQASSGNVKAFETIRDTIGEKPTDNIQITPPTFLDDVKK